ncbi:DUF924 family protein [Microdochium nivale]|nr:DUF924 family protein [Microdochium nivale]
MMGVDTGWAALSNIISRDYLDRLYHLRYPSTQDEAQLVAQIRRWKAGTPPDISEELGQLVRPVLKQLSKHQQRWAARPPPVAAALLPADTLDPAYIRRAIALVFLLDQCPRMYCSSGAADARWVGGFFDLMAQELVWNILLSPPADGQLVPILDAAHWARVGYTFHEFLYISSLILTAADHSEEIGCHRQLKVIVQTRRRGIHEVTGRHDPYVGLLAAEMDSVYTFSQWMRRGLPDTPSVEEFAYLRLAVIDVHWPIIAKFGRYPWRNGSLGRQNTAEEERFLTETNHFGEASADAAEKIALDVEAGTWTGLGD